jgi:hypothetical protein
MDKENEKHKEFNNRYLVGLGYYETLSEKL